MKFAIIGWFIPTLLLLGVSFFSDILLRILNPFEVSHLLKNCDAILKSEITDTKRTPSVMSSKLSIFLANSAISIVIEIMQEDLKDLSRALRENWISMQIPLNCALHTILSSVIESNHMRLIIPSRKGSL